MKLITRTLCVLLSLLTVVSLFGHERDRLFYSYDASNGLADNSAQIVMCTKTGRIMTTTIGHVNFYDGYSFTHIDPHANDAKRLPGYKGRYQIYFDKFHHLWMKHDGLMTCVDLLTERFISNVDSVCRLMGMTRPVDDFYGDGENNFWFRSGQTLYCQALRKEIALRQSAVLQDVDVYRDSLLLLFHADGSVAVNDFQTGRYLYTDHAFADADKSRYTQMSELCLVGSKFYQLRCGEHESVLLTYDADKRQWQQLLHSPFLLRTVYPKNGSLYIGGERGYLVYDLTTGSVEHIEQLKMTKGRLMTECNINSLIFDRQGGMWIGTARRGLLYAKPYNMPFHAYSVTSSEALPYLRVLDEATKHEACLPRKVNTVLRDSRGWRWTGSYNGLELLKPNGERRVFTSRDGLTNEVVHAIIEDQQHDIWVNTSYGIAHLFIRSDSVYHLENYLSSDNIPDEAFLNGRVARMTDGTIVMEGIDHVVVFNPSDFHGKSFGDIVLFPKLIRLMVNGTVVHPGDTINDRVVLERSITRTREFSVDYDQNSLELTFSGLNYLRPVQTYYRVRVKGVAAYNKWKVLSYGKGNQQVDRYGRLRLQLIGLHPGTYVVELQTSLWPETWPQAPFEWTIHVEEPWWRTTGVFLLLGIVLLTLLLANFYFFNRNMRLRIHRHNEESDIVRRIKVFAARCQSLSTEVLTPYSITSEHTQATGMSTDFVDAMLCIVPYVNHLGNEKISMDKLAQLSGIPVIKLYGILAPQLDKNPRQMIGKLRLQEGAELLRTTEMTVEQIAERLHFVSANYFIAAFYHQYRQTPADYRSSMAR